MSSPLNTRNIFGVGITTPDATQIVGATIATLPNNVYQVLTRILAVDTDDFTKLASYILVGAFKNNGGTLAQVGSTTNLSTIESNSAWDVSFAVSGSDIQVKVTGEAAVNVSWLIDAEVKNLQKVLPNSGIIG